MIRRFLLFLAAFTVLTSAGQAQAQKSKAAEAVPPASISDLVLQGKTNDALKLAVKTPAGLDGAWTSLFTSIDTQIVIRNLNDAQKNLDATKAFADACVKSKQVKVVPMDAIQGRQLRLNGIRLSDNKEFVKATDALKEALQLSKKAQDRALEAGVHNNLGFALQQQGQLPDAEKEYDLARRIAEDIKDYLRAGSSNFNLGMVLFDQQKFEDAKSAFARATEQNRAAGQARIEARSILMQGRVAGRLNTKTDDAVKFYQEAQSKFEKIGDDSNVGWCYYLMGEHSGFGGDFVKCAQYVEKGIPYFIKADDKESLRRSYDFLGLIYATMGEKEKADKYSKLAGDVAKELEKTQTKAPDVIKK
jgi:tetratricopeptide (TPR) repeat protein